MEKGQGLQCRISQLGFASWKKKKKEKGKSTVELCSDVSQNFQF